MHDDRIVITWSVKLTSVCSVRVVRVCRKAETSEREGWEGRSFTQRSRT